MFFATRLVSVVVVLLVQATSSKKPIRFRNFKSDLDEIWHRCSSSKYASTARVGFRI